MVDGSSMSVRAAIEEGRTVLGIECGSISIKAVLIGEDIALESVRGREQADEVVRRRLADRSSPSGGPTAPSSRHRRVAPFR